VSFDTFLTNRFITVFLMTGTIANQIHVGSQIILYEKLTKHINRYLIYNEIVKVKRCSINHLMSTNGPQVNLHTTYDINILRIHEYLFHLLPINIRISI
jgi:hypothetical protein